MTRTKRRRKTRALNLGRLSGPLKNVSDSTRSYHPYRHKGLDRSSTEDQKYFALSVEGMYLRRYV